MTIEQMVITAVFSAGFALILTLWNLVVLYRLAEAHKSLASDNTQLTSRETIEQWRASQALESEHSPKWRAYEERLKEVGAA